MAARTARISELVLALPGVQPNALQSHVGVVAAGLTLSRRARMSQLVLVLPSAQPNELQCHVGVVASGEVETAALDIAVHVGVVGGLVVTGSAAITAHVGLLLARRAQASVLRLQMSQAIAHGDGVVGAQVGVQAVGRVSGAAAIAVQVGLLRSQHRAKVSLLQLAMPAVLSATGSASVAVRASVVARPVTFTVTPAPIIALPTVQAITLTGAGSTWTASTEVELFGDVAVGIVDFAINSIDTINQRIVLDLQLDPTSAGHLTFVVDGASTASRVVASVATASGSAAIAVRVGVLRAAWRARLSLLALTVPRALIVTGGGSVSARAIVVAAGGTSSFAVMPDPIVALPTLTSVTLTGSGTTWTAATEVDVFGGTGIGILHFDIASIDVANQRIVLDVQFDPSSAGQLTFLVAGASSTAMVEPGGIVLVQGSVGVRLTGAPASSVGLLATARVVGGVGSQGGAAIGVVASLGVRGGLAMGLVIPVGAAVGVGGSATIGLAITGVSDVLSAAAGLSLGQAVIVVGASVVVVQIGLEGVAQLAVVGLFLPAGGPAQGIRVVTVVGFGCQASGYGDMAIVVGFGLFVGTVECDCAMVVLVAVSGVRGQGFVGGVATVNLVIGVAMLTTTIGAGMVAVRVQQRSRGRVGHPPGHLVAYQLIQGRLATWVSNITSPVT